MPDDMSQPGMWTHPSFDPSRLRTVDEPPTEGTPVARAVVYVVTEECGYDVGRVVRGVYATPEAAMRAHPGEWRAAGTGIDGEPDSWTSGGPGIDRYEVQT